MKCATGKSIVWAVLAGVACLAPLFAWGEPTVSIMAPTVPAEAGQAYRVSVQVRWSGPPETYLVLPVELPEVAWARVRVLGIATGADAEGTVVTQDVELVPTAPGEFELGPLLAPVAEAGGGAEDLAPSVTLQTAPLSVLVVEPRGRGVGWRLVLGGVGVAAAAACGLVLLALRTRKGAHLPAAGLPREEAMKAALSQARRHQLDGLYYEFYRELARAAALAEQEGGNSGLAARLEQRAQEVGFKGVAPTPDELNGAIREVERAVTREMEAQQV